MMDEGYQQGTLFQDIADDLIKLYAERQSALGYGFEKDTQEQHEFEEMFPYEETRDQLRAIEEIKKDMEQNRPMDRLLCGEWATGRLRWRSGCLQIGDRR
jgi:transcription-repair coupling factor (superfamily II helicase)